MKRIKVLVCDDEPYFIQIIEKYCSQFAQENMVSIQLFKCSSVKEVIKCSEKNKNIDIYILDIILKESDGIQLANELRQMDISSKIIFLTSDIKFAPKGYTVGASRYWMKPIDYKQFRNDMLNVLEEIKFEEDKVLLLSTEDGIERVYFDSILYIETEARNTRIHIQNADKLTKITMADYVNKLDNRFYRCHAAYIVNMNYIEKIKGLKIHLQNGQIIYISKVKKRKFILAYTSYITDSLFEGYNKS